MRLSPSRTNASKSSLGFSLLELMLAILFISIALFGYVALHTRILHSGTRLQEREIARRTVANVWAIDQVRLINGLHSGVRGNTLEVVPDVPELRKITMDAPALNPFPPWIEAPKVLTEALPYEVDCYILSKGEQLSW